MRLQVCFPFRSRQTWNVVERSVCARPLAWGPSIKDVRNKEGGLVNADGTVNFTCQRPYFADTGGGGENGSNCADVLYGRPLGLPLLWMLNTKYFVCFLNTLFVAKQGYFKLVFSKNCGTQLKQNRGPLKDIAFLNFPV